MPAFLQVASPRKHSIQVRYYLAVAQLCCMTNYPETQWPVTISIYSPSHSSLGLLGFSRSNKARLQAVSWPWVSSLYLSYFCNWQATCYAFLSWQQQKKAQKGREEPKWTSHFSLCLGHTVSILSAKTSYKAQQRSQRQRLWICAISSSVSYHMCTLKQKSQRLSSSVSCSVKWNNNTYIAGRL